MQSYTDIKDLYQSPKYVDQTVAICGWIKTVRISGGKNKRLGFVKLSDGSCQQHLQIIFDGKTCEPEIFDKASTGVCLKVTGKIVKSPGEGQPIEMQAQTYEILGLVSDPATYPIAKTQLTLEYLRGIPHLRGRTDTFQAIMRIKSCMRFGFAEYFDSIGFPEVQVPCITDNECESGANPFLVMTKVGTELSSIPVKEDGKTIDFTQEFFKKPCYLTVSGQLHLEALVLGGLAKAYCNTIAFRAEPGSNGPRHACEFWMIEQEACFTTIDDNMNINEGALKHVFQRILSKCRLELEFLEATYKPGLIKSLEKYATTPFGKTTHEECVKRMLDDIASGKVTIDPEKIPDSGLYVFKEAPGYADDLSKDHERYIAEVIFGGLPTFVRMYPAKIKAFYMPKVNEGAEIERVENFDLIAPEIGEIVGGSQRESNYEKLIERMIESGIRPETLEFYAELRKMGCPKHGGSGIGFDRVMMMVTGIFSIKDMIPFPRGYETCHF